jgi:hypothetical protein
MALQKELSIDEIRADTAAQPREFMSTDKVEEYADLMKSGVQFPPPVAFFDGSIHWLADGFHALHRGRLRAFGWGYPLWLVGRSRQRTQRHVPGSRLQLDARRCGLCLGRNRLHPSGNTVRSA